MEAEFDLKWNLRKDIPVVVWGCQLGGLSIMRSLGRLGVPVYGIDKNSAAPAMLSKYCRGKFIGKLDPSDESAFLRFLLNVGKQLGGRAILIPTADEWSEFVATHREELRETYLFQDNSIDLVRGLASKKEMYDMAIRNNVPTAMTLFPRHLNDVLEMAEKVMYPVMLKGIYGNRLLERTGKKMAIVHSRDEMIATYKQLEDPELPNLMIQEYIPGGDDQIFIFNGYFNKQGDCLAAFTGYKVRQFPIHVGCASLGECRWNQTVADQTRNFMKAIGYHGILDIGYRYDPRDGKYKVLDINPRVGQAFRLFLARNNMDVVRAMYLDLTGQAVGEVEPREGRRWLIEDMDFISTLDYFREGSLNFGEWIRSFRGVEEGLWYDRRDLRPFFTMVRWFVSQRIKWLIDRLRKRFGGGSPHQMREAAQKTG